ncbi:hypothetical protein ACFSUJ_17950 [Streptomyces lusitanus]|uniref:Uncharacterized protein n=1 Tax=Streptomyces lusitanus TaxID=68232 RepID=A0ABU3JXC0_9ACTN|nr:hypothetical protein [Streptomyces lusitanus]
MARAVGSIGDQQWAAATATSVSHAVLLNSLCLHCDEPLRVTNRSWAVRVGGRYLDRLNDRYLCPECSDVQRQDEEREREQSLRAARAEAERKRLKAEEEARTVAAFLAGEQAKDGSTSHLPYRRPTALALYLVLVNHAVHNPGKPLPSVADLGALGWTGDTERDTEALFDMYRAHLIAISSETPRQAFDISDEDGELRFFATELKWRLVGGGPMVTAHERAVRTHFMTAPGQEAHDDRQALAELVDRMEVINVISYLDGLLTKKYDYPAVPEGRRQELADVVRKGFAAGFTPGQMICFAWRAADSAAAWKERNAHMGPPEASSGTVTILNSKIDTAIEVHHAVPEYDPPRWHQQPVGLAVLRQLDAEVKRVRDRSVISACAQCDHQGLRETDTGALVRCVHTAAVPEQPEAQEYPAEA